MGVLLFDKNADFSANALGHAGLYTSVTNNLLGLFELRRSAAKARKNSAPTNDLEATIGGTPVFNAASMDLTAVGQVTFPGGPGNGGENTVALIIKVKNGGSSSDMPVGSYASASGATASGACYFVNYNRRLQFTTTVHDAPTGAPGYITSLDAYLDAPSDATLDGTFQLYVATLKSQDALKLYWPAVSQVKTTPLAAGRFAYFNPSANNRNWRARGGGSAEQSMAMFAHWDRALSAAEVATFYTEIKKQFGLIGLAI